MKQLAESPIECGAWGDQTKKFFLASLDETSQRIGAKLETINSAAEAVRRSHRKFTNFISHKIPAQIERVAKGQYAYYENADFLRQMRAVRGVAAEGDLETLHIMSECAIHMPISIGMEKNSPMKPRVDELLRRIIESGLAGKWLSAAKRAFESNTEPDPQEALMELKKLYGALVALAIGYAIAITVLVAEIAYWMCVVVRRPTYDKYGR